VGQNFLSAAGIPVPAWAPFAHCPPLNPIVFARRGACRQTCDTDPSVERAVLRATPAVLPVVGSWRFLLAVFRAGILMWSVLFFRRAPAFEGSKAETQVSSGF